MDCSFVLNLMERMDRNEYHYSPQRSNEIYCFQRYKCFVYSDGIESLAFLWWFIEQRLYKSFGSSRNSHVLTLTELPPDGVCNCSGDPNEVVGKNIRDLQCSVIQCVALTNESKLYSWGDDSNILGRESIDENNLTPMEVNNSRLHLLITKNNIEIKGLFVQNSLTFILLMDHTENRKRIFGFGEDYFWRRFKIQND